MLAYEPLVQESADGVRLLGMEVVRSTGAWPVFRHVFDLDWDAALYIDVDLFCSAAAYGIGFSPYGDELLTPL